MVLVAPEIIWVLGGDRYTEGAWIIAPIAASIFFRFLYSLYANIEFYYEENYFIMFASVICALLNIVLNYIFIKKIGYLAAGFTTLVCFAFYSVSHFVFSQKVLKKYTSINSLYDNKFIFGVGFVISAINIGVMSLYRYVFIRYFIIFLIGLNVIIFKKEIIRILKKIRERN